MSNPIFEPWIKSTTSVTASLKDLGDIYAKAAINIGELQQSALLTWVEAGRAQFDAVRKFKTYDDWAAYQTKVMREQSDKLVALSREAIGVVEASQSELSAWITKHSAAATETLGDVFKPKKAA